MNRRSHPGGNWGNPLGPDVFPALTLRQPWAYAVLHLGKRIENRPWSTKFRGEFLIHTAMWPGDVVTMAEKADRSGRRSRPLDAAHEEALGMIGMAKDFCVPLPATTLSMREIYADRGAIVGVARLVDILPPCRGSLGDLFDAFRSFRCGHAWHMPEQYGFRLADVRPVPVTPWKGCLGFFGVPLDVARPLLRGAA